MDTLGNENAKNAFFSFFGQKKMRFCKKSLEKVRKGQKYRLKRTNTLQVK